MAKIRIKQASLKKAVEKVGKWTDEQTQKALKALAMLGEDIVAEIIAEIEKVGATDTRELIASIDALKPVLVKTFAELKIITDAGYAGVIEYGRRPGQPPPPLHVLVGWAARKGITSNIPVTADIDTGEYLKAKKAAYSILKNRDKKKASGAKQTTSTFLGNTMVGDFVKLISIQRAIGRLGQEGRYPFTNVMNKRKATLPQDFREYFLLLK